MKELTQTQQELLAEVRREGSRTYDGRWRRPIKALERAGLVNVVWGMRPQAKGDGTALVWQITVTPRG